MSRTRIAALVLAAGRSTRMGEANKLLATFDGVPLVRRTVDTVLAAAFGRVVVVIGHQADAIRAALAGCPVEFVENDGFAAGLSTSLRAGFAAAAKDADGVMVVLADQPGLRPEHLRDLEKAFHSEGLGAIVVAAHEGTWGNPVILPVAFAPAIGRVTGDKGARDVLKANAASVRAVEIGPAALFDVDTPERLLEAGGAFAAPLGRS